jgi:hypothetical protein
LGANSHSISSSSSHQVVPESFYRPYVSWKIEYVFYDSQQNHVSKSRLSLNKLIICSIFQ